MSEGDAKVSLALLHNDSTPVSLQPREERVRAWDPCCHILTRRLSANQNGWFAVWQVVVVSVPWSQLGLCYVIIAFCIIINYIIYYIKL